MESRYKIQQNNYVGNNDYGVFCVRERWEIIKRNKTAIWGFDCYEAARAFVNKFIKD